MQLLWAGFLVGLTGGVHCLLMCGPLAVSVQSAKFGNINQWVSRLLYQGGRIFSYLTIGLIFGVIGKIVSIIFYQQILSIVSGSLLVIWAVFIFFPQLSSGNSRLMRMWSKITSGLFGNLWKRKTPFSIFGLGMLNGFLPCGLVYLAASASMHEGNVSYSLMFMLLFGLGTLPAMVGVIYSKKIFPSGLRISFKKLTPVFVCGLGLLFILRGMDLNIPYLSPHISQAANGEVHSCCKRK